jgi:hypothetical protein
LVLRLVLLAQGVRCRAESVETGRDNGSRNLCSEDRFEGRDHGGGGTGNPDLVLDVSEPSGSLSEEFLRNALGGSASGSYDG